MFDLEKEIKRWKAKLRKNQALEDGYIEELESHLRDEIDKGIAKDKEKAFYEAVRKIGEIEYLGAEYYKSDSTNIIKHPPWKELPFLPNLVVNYLKVAFRILLRQKGYSFINIFGLAIGMAACLLIFQYVTFEKSYDTYHDDYENIYRVLNYRYYTSGLDKSAGCAALVGPTMKEEFPEVLSFTRFKKIIPTVRYNDTIFKENMTFFADSSFFSMFSFRLIEGDPRSALREPYSVVFTKSTAEKYFGYENPIGKTIYLWNSTPCKVTGLAEDVPENTHIKFDMLISFVTQFSEQFCWPCNNKHTYIKVAKGTDPRVLESKFPSIINKIHADENNSFERAYFLQPIADMHLTPDLRFEFVTTGDGETVNILSLVALFIIIIAWLNYINLSTARSINRAKETGLRKVIGAGRKQLIRQFLLESLLLNTLGVIAALIIVCITFNSFTELLNKNFTFTLLSESNFWIMLIGITLAGSFLSGLYPAFVLSSFSPVTIFKDKITGTGKSALLRKGLTIFQFAIAIALIASTITVYNQISFMRSRDLGLEIEQTVAVNWASNFSEGFDYYGVMDAFVGELSDQTSIKDITFSSIYPGIENTEVSGGIRLQGSSPEDGKQIYSAWIADNFLDFFNIDLICGRNYLESDLTNLSSSNNGDKGIIINESAVKVLGLSRPEEALGKIIIYDDEIFGRVVGVINDYHQQSLDKMLRPTIFFGGKWGFYYIFKIDTHNIDETLSIIKDKFNNYYPGNAFVYSFIDEVFDNQYKSDIQFGNIFSLFALFAILIACLGLFGLASFTTLQRTKEIGIRKVLGASIQNILVLIAKDFFQLIFISIAIAIPAAYYVMNKWLENYAYKSNIGWWFYVLPIIFIVAVASFAIGYQIVKAAFSNPVESLRTE